jgi:dsDNA-specific endonuclease/ATPase MutS2
MVDQKRYQQLNDSLQGLYQARKNHKKALEEERDQKIRELLAKANRCVEELDPIVRETLKDKPEALAEWDEIMHMCDDIPEDEKL